MPASLKNFKENIAHTLIETGSYLGEGISLALQAGFKQVISIEIAEKYFQICTRRFKNNNKVVLLYGDSSIKLSEAIDLAKGDITFWLDGHWSGADTGKGSKEVPLVEELEQIKQTKPLIKAIIIDDIWQAERNEISKERIESLLLDINDKMEFSYYLVKDRIQRLTAKVK